MITADTPRVLTLGPARIEIRATAAETDGKVEAFAFTVPPGAPTPGRHVHENSDEHFAVLAGVVEFDIDGVRTIARAGQTMVAPRGSVHDWRNAGDVPVEMLITFTPAIGMAAYFAELFDLFARGEMGVAARQTLWRKYDIRPA